MLLHNSSRRREGRRGNILETTGKIIGSVLAKKPTAELTSFPHDSVAASLEVMLNISDYKRC